MSDKWYRVVVSPDGVQSVDKADAVGDAGSRIYYVKAKNKENASTSGRAAFGTYCAARLRESAGHSPESVRREAMKIFDGRSVP